MLDYEVGPPKDGDEGVGGGAASPGETQRALDDKMKRDCVLGIKSLPTLPAKTRDVLNLMGAAGWGEAGVSEERWIELLRAM